MVPHVTSLFTEKGKTFVGKYDHKNNQTIKTAAHLCTQQPLGWCKFFEKFIALKLSFRVWDQGKHNFA